MVVLVEPNTMYPTTLVLDLHLQTPIMFLRRGHMTGHINYSHVDQFHVTSPSSYLAIEHAAVIPSPEFNVVLT